MRNFGRRARRLAFAAVLLLVLAAPACRDGNLTLGLAGCDFLAATDFPRNPETTVNQGFRGGLTADGVAFLAAHRDLLARLIFQVDAQGRVHLPIPDLQLGGANAVGVRDLEVTFDLPDVGFEMQALPDPPRLHVAVTGARLAVFQGILTAQLDAAGLSGDAACQLGNGIDLGTPQEALANVDFAFDASLEVDELGGLRATVGALDLTLHDFGYSVTVDMTLPECDDGAPDHECQQFCGLVQAGGQVFHNIYELFAAQLESLLRDALQTVVDSILRQFEGQPLQIVGRLKPALFAGLLPTVRGAYPIDFLLAPSPGGFRVDTTADAVGARGAELTLDVGLTAPDHPCVPAAASLGPAPRFEADPASLAMPLSGVGADGAPYHAGLTLSDAVVNRALWVAYRAGVVCLTVDQSLLSLLPSLPTLDSSLLELALPGLATLTGGPRPFAITIEPSFAAGDFDLVRFREVPRAADDVVPRAGVDVHLPRIVLSFYVFIEGRMTRVFSVRTSIDLALQVAATTPQQLSIFAEQPRLGALEVLYDEPVAGQNLAAMTDLLLSLAQSTLLQDGLRFDLPISGLVERATGIRLDVGIVDLSTLGGRALTAGVRLADPANAPGQALRAQVETVAAAEATIIDNTANLEVGASGASHAMYQWRFPGGAWSALAEASDGRFSLQSGRLQLAVEQAVEIRAVDVTRPDGAADPTPAGVRLTRSAPVEIADRADTAACQAAPGRAGPAGLAAPGLAALLLAALGRKRRRMTAVGAVAAVAAVAVLATACDDTPHAKVTHCLDTSECPGGLLCIDAICQPVPACAATTDCCPGSECRQDLCQPAAAACAADADCLSPLRACVAGLCVQRPCADNAPCAAASPDATCVAGTCHAGPPCDGLCDAAHACFPDLDVCAPADCAPCAPGQVRVAAHPGDFRGPLCDLGAVTCACVAAPPLKSDDVGRHASLVLRYGEPVFAAYDGTYGDLVLVQGVEAHALDLQAPIDTPPGWRPTDAPEAPSARSQIVTYLDGAPVGGLVQADPSGPRGGVTTPGPDRGRYASAAMDVKGRLDVAYYDATEGNLRYLRDDAGLRFQAPIVVDGDGDGDGGGDIGRFARLKTDSRARIHIVSHAARLPDGQTGLRYAFSRTADPIGPQDFDLQTIAAGPPSLQATPGVGEPADGTGVAPCLAIGPDDRAYVAFSVVTAGRHQLRLAVQGAQGFSVFPLDAQLDPSLAEDAGDRYADWTEHDLGGACDLAVRLDGTVDLVFPDGDTHDVLLYEGPPEGGGHLGLVDAGEPGAVRLLGADPAMVLDPLGEPVLVYQDQAQNDVRFTRRVVGAFLAPRSLATAGALGFYNGLVLAEDRAVVGTLELRTTAAGRAALALHVFRAALPLR